MLDWQAKGLFDAYQTKLKAQQQIIELEEQLNEAKAILRAAVSGPIFGNEEIGFKLKEHGYIFKICKHYNNRYLQIEQDLNAK